MEGFDTRGFEVDHVYTVDEALGDYLVESGYATPEPAAHAHPTTRAARDRRSVIVCDVDRVAVVISAPNAVRLVAT
jgi:hypothetical protein